MMGYKSIAVPGGCMGAWAGLAPPGPGISINRFSNLGELHGYWTAFKRFSSGRIAWQDLVMPTVKLLSDGYPITKQMEINLGFAEERMNHTSNIRSFFTNNATGKFYREGEILKNPQLAETYRKLAVSSDPVR
jgi:gamma-glutamyltranspeptidase